MNILIVNWAWYPTGGDWTYVHLIKEIYEEYGHKVIPFSMKNPKNEYSPYSKYFIDEIDYKIINKKRTIKNILKVATKSIYSIEAKRNLESLLKENEVDIAQLASVNNYQTPSVVDVLRKHNIPIVWRILDYKLICPNATFVSNDKVCELCTHKKYYNCIINKCKKESYLASTVAAFESYFYRINKVYKYVDMFSFQSAFTKNKYIEYGFDNEKAVVIENPVEYETILPQYTNRGYVLYYGRIERLKGIYTLLKAMQILPHIELKVIGNGSDLEKCKTYVNANSVKNVSFLGPLWDEDLNNILLNCSFVIVPSEWYEPSPYSVLQSFASGKTVIGAKIGGIQDLIIDDYNGLLFEPGNHQDLASKILSLSNDKDKTVALGNNARKSIEKNHGKQKYYEKSIRLFEKLIGMKIK